MCGNAQTAPDLVAKIKLSFQFTALDLNRAVFFFLAFFTNGNIIKSLGELLKIQH
jgi:hypothetical protein